MFLTPSSTVVVTVCLLERVQAGLYNNIEVISVALTETYPVKYIGTITLALGPGALVDSSC